jgi:D-cysteine desulfhydrase
MLSMIPLFQNYQKLAQKLPHIPLADLPTPVYKIGDSLGIENLYIKQDSVSAMEYGGNKIRKLEFLLGMAIRDERREVMTFGCAGSNHALATSIYANKIGINAISMLIPQPNAYYIRKNLLMGYSVGAELHYYSSRKSLFIGKIFQLFVHKIKTGQLPQIIPPGGSSPLGTIGFVNAAFELKQQIQNGSCPEPDYIYVALGTMGTAAGLILGLAAAGLKTKVICVRVVGESIANKPKLINLLRKTNVLLNESDPSFPIVQISKIAIEIRNEFFGGKYALFTREGVDAVDLVKKSAGIHLEETYTGKAFAALIHDAKNKRLLNNKVLFWNTYNSIDFSKFTNNADYRKLPKPFHHYFEQEVQQLDKKS